jgi:muconate cycloisomerase
MRPVRVVVRHVRVPLKHVLRTAQGERSESESVIVEVRLDSGVSGFGEGAPLERLTGETPRGCFDYLRPAAAALCGRSCDDFAAAVELAGELPFDGDPLRPRCAARAALEIAVLDAAGRSFDVSLSRLVEFLPDFQSIAQRRDEVRYGAVVPADAGVLSALWRRLEGFGDVKLTVGVDPARDVEFVGRMRRRLGKRVDLRVDASGAWSIEEATKILRKLRPLNVSFVEQPLPVEDVMQLGELRSKTGVPVILDESLVSERDAQLAVDGRLCDAFSLGVSKNGGILPVLRLAKLAMESRTGVQLGFHPGETGILSAAGRAVACSVRNLLYLEGSCDRRLLRRNVIREDITVGRAGRAARLAAPGLGVTVDARALDHLTVDAIDVQ